MNKSVFQLFIILSLLFLSYFKVGATLAPQVYITEIGLEKRNFEPGEEVNGFVRVWNYEELVLSDLIFHFQILGEHIDGIATKIIDEQVSKESFTLSPDREIRKSFSYTLPANLPQGNFKFRVQITNSRGEEMSWIDKIINVKGENKFIVLDNYWLVKQGKKFPSGAGVAFQPGEKGEVQFEVFNNSSLPVEVFPKILTYKRNVNSLLKEQEGEVISLKQGERKVQRFPLPDLKEPESYLSEVRLYDAETRETISNTIFFRWIVLGDNAEILFVKPDKIFYKPGEEAKIEIHIAGQPVYDGLSSPKGTIEVKLFNGNDDLVGENRQEIELKDSKILTNVSITKEVNGPKIRTRIFRDGKVLDEYDFRVVPEGGVIAPDTTIKRFDLWAKITLAILILAILAIMGIVIKIAREKFKNRDREINKSEFKMPKFTLFILLILFGIGFLFLVSDKALAAVEVTGGCQDILMVYNGPLPRRVYKPNDIVTFSGKFKITGPSSSLFFNKITFYITEDRDISISDCCGDFQDDCDNRTSCMCKEGYLNYYGASSSFYNYQPNKLIRWFDEVKFLNEKEKGVRKLGTIYPSDTLYGTPYLSYNQSFKIPEDLGFSGPVRFYVQYSGTNFNDNWQWSITYQKGWIIENKPPFVDSPGLDGEPVYCGFEAGKGRMGLKWTYQDPDKDDQLRYQLQISTGASFIGEQVVIDYYSSVFEGNPAGNINTSSIITIVNNPNFDNLELGYNQEYHWRVRVQDKFGNWSNWIRGPSFKTPSHAYPWPRFKWNPQSPLEGENVSFVDDSSLCYRTNGQQYNCKEEDNIKYKWDFGEPLAVDNISYSKIGASHKYLKAGNYKVMLKISDGAMSCSTYNTITVTKERLFPPGFRPVGPTGWFNNLLSMIYRFLPQ